MFKYVLYDFRLWVYPPFKVLNWRMLGRAIQYYDWIGSFYYVTVLWLDYDLSIRLDHSCPPCFALPYRSHLSDVMAGFEGNYGHAV